MAKRLILAMFCGFMLLMPAMSQNTIKGKASYYGSQFHGRKMANGQTFNMYALTCAHKTWKFGTKIKVTNNANGKSVVLTVTDRGPYVRGRILDVSYKAAQELGFLRQGVADVTIEFIDTAVKNHSPALEKAKEYNFLTDTFFIDSFNLRQNILPEGKHSIDSIASFKK